MKCYPYLLFLCAFPFFCKAQTTADQPPLLRVYLDQFNPPRSNNYLKTTVEFVNFTAKPTDCDVRVQLTEEAVGNGTRRYLLYFYGEKDFAGQNDTTECTLPPMRTSLVLENQLVETFKAGLLPYLLKTAWADRIQFSTDSSIVKPLFENAWNRSTFLVATSGTITSATGRQYFQDQIQGEQTFRSANTNTQLAWWYVGQCWRWAAESDWNYVRQKRSSFSAPTTPSLTITESENTQISGNLSAVRRLTERFSAGAFLSLNRSDALRVQPQTIYNTALGVEYSALPYADFFRRRLLFSYYLDLQHYSNRVNQSPMAELPTHRLLAQYAQRTRKAYFSANVGGNIRFSTQYWHIWGVSAEVTMGFEIKRNLFLTVNARARATNDRSASAISVDLPVFYTNKAREYRYRTAIGVIYLFGSGHRNILNPGLSPLNFNQNIL